MSDNGLKELIRKRGYRLDHVAKEVGLNTGTLRAIMNGHRKTSRPVLKLLSQVLAVPEQELEKMGLLQSEAS